ncbi:hypothetical protein Tco_0914151 [Tanacetum coccineum]
MVKKTTLIVLRDSSVTGACSRVFSITNACSGAFSITSACSLLCTHAFHSPQVVVVQMTFPALTNGLKDVVFDVRCYSDSVLHDHLRRNLHKRMYETVKATLLKRYLFPLNDGTLFFHDTREEDEGLV